MAEVGTQIAQVAGQPASVRVGTVTGINPFVVSAQGAVFNNVGWLGSYVPQAGDAVIMLGQSSQAGADPASWVVLGRASSVPGGGLQITQLRRNSAQVIGDSTFTAISWDGIVIDTLNAFPPGSSTGLTMPHDGYYEFTGHCSFLVNAVGQRQSLWFVNGSSTDSFVSMNAVATIGTRWAMQTFYANLNAGDLVQMMLWQNSGGGLGVEVGTGLSPTLTARYLGTTVT